MTARPLVFRRKALTQLEDLHDYIAEAGSPESAAHFTQAIVTFCEGLAAFPNLRRSEPRHRA